MTTTRWRFEMRPTETRMVDVEIDSAPDDANVLAAAQEKVLRENPGWATTGRFVCATGPLVRDVSVSPANIGGEACWQIRLSLWPRGPRDDARDRLRPLLEPLFAFFVDRFGVPELEYLFLARDTNLLSSGLIRAKVLDAVRGLRIETTEASL